MKQFFKGMIDGFCSFGLVAGGAIGGMTLLSGITGNDKACMFAGLFAILANMVAAFLQNLERKNRR